MTGSREIFNGESLADSLAEMPLIRRIYFFEEIDSTSTFAAKLLNEAGSPRGLDGTLVVADHQNAGRGRMNRKWISAPGQNLMFSLILAPDLESAVDENPDGENRAGDPPLLNVLALAAPLAVMAALESVVPGHCVAIKYPNDVLIDGAKCSGILIGRGHGRGLEGAQGHAWYSIGVGININEAPAESDLAGAYPATCIAGVIEAVWVDRLPILARVIANLQSYALLPVQVLADRMKASCETLGKFISMTTPTGIISGTALGISRDGGLILRQESGAERIVYSGDILGA